MTDKLSFLDGGSNPAEPSSTPAQTPAPEPVNPEPAQAPVVPEAPVVIAPPEPQPASSVPPGHVPLAALLDEREKRKADRDRLAKLEQELNAARSQPQDVPDMFSDPDGYRARQEQLIRQETWNVRADLSQAFAEQQFGKEKVDEAVAEFMAKCPPGSPHALELLQQRNPYGYVMQWHDQQKMLADPDAFVRRRAAELGLIPQAAQTLSQPPAASQQPAPQRPSIPMTIANAPSAAGVGPSVPTGPGVAFEAVFKR